MSTRPLASPGAPVLTALLAVCVLAAQPCGPAQGWEPTPIDGAGGGGASVVETVHNLSASGPGQVRAQAETEVCVFCHTPHGGSGDAPLWNRARPAAALPFGAGEGPVGGSSLLCLSCHDGTLALGSVRSRSDQIAMRGSGRLETAPDGALAGDGSHPVSIPMGGLGATGSGRPGLLRPAPVDRPWLTDPTGAVQCSSCHDPHADDNHQPGRVPRFWRDLSVAETCERCHLAPVNQAGHDGARLPLGCASCHRAHGQPDTPLLPEADPAFCLECHGRTEDLARQVEAGGVALGAAPADIRAEFDKPHPHPLSGAPVTRRIGGLQPFRDDGPEGCGACHAVHGTLDAASWGSHLGTGLEAAEVDNPEVCFGCHGGSAARSPLSVDLEAVFSELSVSAHPVGRRTRAGLGRASAAGVMTCGSCHGSDERDGPAGPHGSRYRSLLRLPYDDADTLGGADAPLCTSCHDPGALSDTRSGWPGHRLHVDIEQAGCGDCHDPHGSLAWPGLIHYGQDARDQAIRPSLDGRLEYLPDAQGGTCLLSCHDVEHGAALRFAPIGTFAPAGVRR